MSDDARTKTTEPDVDAILSLAEALCRADESWEHHDATDDFPCLRCKALAVRMLPTIAAHTLAAVEQERAAWAARLDALQAELDNTQVKTRDILLKLRECREARS